MATTKWVVDPTHSEIGFKVKHMMFTNLSGSFTQFEATAETEDDSFENAKFDFSANTESVNTGNNDRDNHLRSEDFFDSEQFPKMTFTSSSFTKKGGGEFTLTGDLTIRGTKKTITLDVEFGGTGQDPWGNVKAGVSATGKLNRKDFGLTWNSALETGGVLVGDEVKLQIELQFVKA